MQPRWPDDMKRERADLLACRASLRSRSRSFHLASLLLPPACRAPASALYAFCRMADDEVDCTGDGLVAVARVRRRLSLIYAGRPLPLPADRAFAAVVERHAIPAALPFGLLEGLEWDAEGRTYRDIDAVQAYAVRVAGTVGAMMALVMGVRDEQALARAVDLGVAMQLTNIARDVGEDARLGRIYLPLDWLDEAGIDSAAWLGDPKGSEPLRAVVLRLLSVAETLYDRSVDGIAGLPASCRPAIHAARLIYREIGRRIVRDAIDPVARRAVVPAPRKVRALVEALAAAALAGPARDASPMLEAARMFVEQAACARRDAGADVQGLTGRLIWVLDLFARLERRDLEAGASRS